MPAKKTKTKKRTGSSSSKKRVSVSAKSRKRKPTAKRAGPKRTKLNIPDKMIAASARVPQKKRYRTFLHRLELGTASLALLLAGSLTTSAALASAGADLKRSEQNVALELSLNVQPKEYLYKVAADHDVDYVLLERIAYCESRWRMVKSSASTAYGFFQIIDGTERATPAYKEGRRKFDPLTNIDMAVALYERYGALPWLESKPCWWRYAR